MPGADDTLNAGGPQVDPLDELCTCGHTRGEHHTLDEDCTNPACKCPTFHATNPEFGNSAPSPDVAKAILDAHQQAQADALDGAMMGTLDQRLDPDKMHGAGDGFGGTDEGSHLHIEPTPTRNNTREAIDRSKSNADLAYEMDADPMSPTVGMSDEQRAESDAVQAETLANLCTCGHPYGIHAAVDDVCLDMGCPCAEFDALLKPVDAREPDDLTTSCFTGNEADKPQHPGLDPKNLTFAHDENIGPAPEDIVENAEAHRLNPDEIPRQTADAEPPSPEAWRENSAIDHEALERDRRLPYTPPLLRKKYVGGDELRKILKDAGRLHLLEELPEVEVDRVTTNYGAEHWKEIERLALFPQGSSETTRPDSERTITAIATALLELRQSLGATYSNSDALMAAIQKNAEVVDKTVETLELMSARLLPVVAKVLRDEEEKDT